MWILVTTLPSADFNFVVDYEVFFLLLVIPRRKALKIHKTSPKFTIHLEVCQEKFLLDFWRSPFLLSGNDIRPGIQGFKKSAEIGHGSSSPL